MTYSAEDLEDGELEDGELEDDEPMPVQSVDMPVQQVPGKKHQTLLNEIVFVVYLLLH